MTRRAKHSLTTLIYMEIPNYVVVASPAQQLLVHAGWSYPRLPITSYELNRIRLPQVNWNILKDLSPRYMFILESLIQFPPVAH